jgi:hypothetical protein
MITANMNILIHVLITKFSTLDRHKFHDKFTYTQSLQYTLADLTTMYKKYQHQRPKHILL